MNYTLKQARKIVSEYRKLMKESDEAGYWSYQDPMSVIDKLEALGLEWGDKLNIPRDFSVRKVEEEFHIYNSAFNYTAKKGEWLIHWDNGNIGQYQFVSGEKAYYAVKEEWAEFKQKLLSYNPLDYDTLNCHIIYDIENGKRLMVDYNKICKNTRAKMQEKIKQVELQKAKENYERLLAELKEDDK